MRVSSVNAYTHRVATTDVQLRDRMIRTGWIGAQFGLTELGELFRQLAETGLRFELAGDVARLRSNFMLGITSMPVSVAGKDT